MNQEEIYNGRYRLDDEVVHVRPVARSQSEDRESGPKVTRLPEVGPAGMMKGVYAPRDHRELVCSGGCGRNIPAGEAFRFVGKSFRFRRPICGACFIEGWYPDVWKAFGYTSEPDYSGKDMPEWFYKYGRTRGGPKIGES